MKNIFRNTILAASLVLILVLAACGPTPTPQPTELPATQAIITEIPATESPASAEPTLTITGAVDQELALTDAELRAMEVVKLNAEHPKKGPTDYEGVRLSEVLAKSGVQAGASKLVFTASDGYTSEVPYADVEACADCLIAFDGSDLTMVMPGMSSKAWAKMVVKIEVIAGAAEAPVAPANPNIILATTTSVQDSGLLDELIPLFEAQTGYKLQTVAVGSGAAMTMGQEGNADVLFVHSPSAEKTFMSDGWGKDRFLIAHNYFIIVGPASDPAKIKGLSAVDAFNAIAVAESPFAARADKSGTSTKELGIWKSAGIDPATTKPAWYIETGQGMGATLTIASEKGGYTLTDQATFLANKANLQLELLVESDKSLLNAYHVITIDTAKWPKVNYDGAMAFAKFMTDPATQEVIGKFGMDKYGAPLFIPDADKTDADLGL